MMKKRAKMKMKIVEVFPTLFYAFEFSQDQIRPLCEEIQDKKEELKRRYYNDHSEPIPDDYWTDYVNPITFPTYEKIVREEILSRFLPEMKCKHLAYWTAIYGEKGYHGLHNHNLSLYDNVIINMSSILYLSDIGHTVFYNPRQGTDEIQRHIEIPSVVGKMIMFPSHILHVANPHGITGKEKVIMSSNWQVYNVPCEVQK